jgi:hypothetical protein
MINTICVVNAFFYTVVFCCCFSTAHYKIGVFDGTGAIYGPVGYSWPSDV